MDLKGFYKANFKKLMLLPSMVLLLSLAIIYSHHQSTGFWVDRDIDFEGGTSLTLEWGESVESVELERRMRERTGEEVSVSVATDYLGEVKSVTFESGREVESGELKGAVEKVMGVELTGENHSVKSVGPAMGATFLQSAQRVMVAAFLLTGAVAFLLFRVPEVSVSIFLCSIINVVGTVAGMNLFGISLNQGSLAALLMFIGGSIDDNILIVSRALEKKTNTVGHAFLAFDTGIVMFVTSFFAYLILRVFTNIPLFIDFASVLMIGSAIDIVNTWLQNMGMVLWYVERKEGKSAL